MKKRVAVADYAYVELLGFRSGHTTFVPTGERWELTQFPVVVGQSEAADIVIPHSLLAARHGQFHFDGAWHFEDFHTESGSFLRSERIRDVALVDGDVIELGFGALRFRAGAPPSPIAGIARRGRWVTFSPFAHRLSYALADGDAEMRTACDRPIHFVRAPSGASVAVVDAEHQVIEDVAGVLLVDVVLATARQGAMLDARSPLAALTIMARLGRAGPVHDCTLLTWRGDVVVVVPRALPPEPDDGSLLALDFIRLTAVSDGGREIDALWDPALRETRDDVMARLVAPYQPHAAPATELLPHTRAGIDEALALAGGPPAPEDVRGLLTNLFPERAVRDARIREDAAMLGAAGVAALERPRACALRGGGGVAR